MGNPITGVLLPKDGIMTKHQFEEILTDYWQHGALLITPSIVIQ